MHVLKFVWRSFATGSAGAHSRRFLSSLVVLIALGTAASSQLAISAPLTATWGGGEVHGGTPEQRSLARAEVAYLSGQPFVFDEDALRALCSAVRKRVAQSDAQCSLIFSNSGQVYYLVELPNGAGMTVPATPDSIGGSYVLPSFLIDLHDRFSDAYETNLRSLRPERYDVRGGRVHFGVRVLDQISAALAQAVPANVIAIRGVLAHADDPKQRAHAAFLLGWSLHSEEDLRKSLQAFHDPDETVRNNYSMIAAFLVPAVSESFQGELATNWCEAIAKPVFTDRSKALLGLSRIQPTLRRSLPDRCKDTIASIGRETAIAEVRRMAAIIVTTD